MSEMAKGSVNLFYKLKIMLTKTLFFSCKNVFYSVIIIQKG